jgi:hypothetical protein
MFVDVATAARIERSEVEITRVMTTSVIASGHAPDGFVRALDAGVAAFVRDGSPMNKVIGAGIEAPIDPMTLALVEAAMRTRGEPVRIELPTLAIPESGAWLTARGYRLLGRVGRAGRAGDGGVGAGMARHHRRGGCRRRRHRHAGRPSVA